MRFLRGQTTLPIIITTRIQLINALAKRLKASPVYTLRFFADANTKQTTGRNLWEVTDPKEAHTRWLAIGEFHEAGSFQLSAGFVLGGKIAKVVKRQDNQLSLPLPIGSGEEGSPGVPEGAASAPDHRPETTGDSPAPLDAG